ncbi:MAG TPA: glycosyltransferase family 9 protein [Bacteroidia bacterium]|jgi:ADP-heptose:LPS heptosyltransferase|nr:glycosyltransferase family 9 protein [Bacteroidia bacterium]
MNRIKRRLKETFINWVETLFFSKKVAANEDILILRLDQIGDYMLFRNFIEEVYDHYLGKRRIVLCGNILWKDLAERLDKHFVSEFIWVDPLKLDQAFYLFSVYKKIIKANCSTLLHPVYSRTVEGDRVALFSGAEQIIGWDGDTANISLERKSNNNTKYTKLFKSSELCLFEFYRNKLFFEQVLGTNLNIKAPYIKVNKAGESQKKHIVIFPGAGHRVRRWSPDNFVKLYKLIQVNLNLPVIVGGSVNDKSLAQQIVSQIGLDATDMTGKMNLSETVDLLQNAALVITNDSGPLHIALALGIPTVCISNGNNYARFCPYPQEMNAKLKVVFPDEIDKILSDTIKSKSIEGKESFIDVNVISPEKVFSAIKNGFLNQYDA